MVKYKLNKNINFVDIPLSLWAKANGPLGTIRPQGAEHKEKVYARIEDGRVSYEQI